MNPNAEEQQRRENEENNIAQKGKRRRTNDEIEDQTSDDDMHHLDVAALLPSEGSTTSLFSNESRETIVNKNNNDQGKNIAPREYRAPHRSVYQNDDDAERLKIIKLERQKDKEDRYSSHIEFLNDCYQSKIIPKGLRLEIEPSIGNNDTAFREKWYKTLEDCSLSLMKDAIEYCEKMENEASKSIATQSEELKTLLGSSEHKKLMDNMNDISAQRRHRLQSAKKKKFQHLRYHRTERPERQDPQPSTRHKDERNTARRNQAVTSDDDRARRRNTTSTSRRTRDTYEYSSEEESDRRSTRFRPARRETNYMDDHQSRNRPHGGEHSRGPSNSGRERPQETQRRDIPRIQVANTDAPREKQYRDILMSAHSRPGSKTNLYRGSNHNLSRKSSHATNRQTTDPKDEEIRRLERQLKEATASKNEARPPQPQPPNETPRDKKTEEVMKFIAQTMKALEAFKEQLSK